MAALEIVVLLERVQIPLATPIGRQYEPEQGSFKLRGRRELRCPS
jgi:hypothetical protein